MQLYLARHGQTDDNIPPVRFQGQSDTPLNEHGRQQAAKLASSCDGLGIEMLFSSNLSRARETAALIAERLNVSVNIDERLAEGWRGRWEGHLFDEVKKSEPDKFAEWLRAEQDFRFPEGESLAEHRERSLDAITDIAGQGKCSLIVAHGGTIRLILLAASGRDISEFHQVQVPNAEIISLAGDQLERVLETSRLHLT